MELFEKKEGSYDYKLVKIYEKYHGKGKDKRDYNNTELIYSVERVNGFFKDTFYIYKSEKEVRYLIKGFHIE